MDVLRENNKVDIVVFSFLNKIIAFENPYSEKQIQNKSLLQLFSNLRDFSFKDSQLNCLFNDLKDRIKREMRVIRKISGR